MIYPEARPAREHLSARPASGCAFSMRSFAIITVAPSGLPQFHEDVLRRDLDCSGVVVDAAPGHQEEQKTPQLAQLAFSNTTCWQHGRPLSPSLVAR
jgi:hypothetical protein